MEKPLAIFNLKTGVNKKRYQYFFGDTYPIYFCIQITFIFNILTILIFGSISTQYISDNALFIFSLLILSFSFALFMLKLFLTNSLKENIGASFITTLFNGLSIPFICSIFDLIKFNEGFSNIGLRVAYLLLLIVIYYLIYKNVGRITIYPNRIVLKHSIINIKKITFDLRYVKKIQWKVGEIEHNIPDEYKDESKYNIQILTPLHYEDDFPDCVMYHHYIFIEEIPEKDTVDSRIPVYVMQPMSFRNAFARNAKNAWIEDWRWDGKLKFVPEDWKPKVGKDGQNLFSI